MGELLSLHKQTKRLELHSCNRNASSPIILNFCFTRVPTDAEKTFLEDVMKRAALVAGTAEPHGGENG